MDAIAAANQSVGKVINDTYRSTIVKSPDLFGQVNLVRLGQDMRDIGGTRSGSVGLFVAGMPFGPDRLQAAGSAITRREGGYDRHSDALPCRQLPRRLNPL